MRRETVRIRFGGTQEQQAFNRELAERPDLLAWLRAGAQAADLNVGSRIMRGVLGQTEATINAAVAEFGEAGLRGLRQADADESQAHFWRLGFMAAAEEARDVRLGRGLPMSLADRVQRAAEHPSQGVGPSHGLGEPPAADA